MKSTILQDELSKIALISIENNKAETIDYNMI